MKKVLSVLSAFIMIFAVMPLSAFAAVAYTSGRYTYNITNDEVTITDVNTSISGDVTIPSKLGGCPVTVIDSYAFEQCSNITSVTIPDCVISIGAGAFYKCKNLTAVTIGGSVIKIGDGAFDECDSLESVTIPNSVKIIGNFAFSFCKSLATVTIPDSVTSIGNGAFESCSSLESVTIGNSVTSIGDCAFKYCDSLTTITIPDSVTSIGDSAFNFCDSLTTINVDQNNEVYSSLDGVLFNKNKTELICCPGGKSGEYVIPDSVKIIGNFAFSYCKSLATVTIPDSVTSIGDNAFSSCHGLESITIPDSVTSIGDSAFSRCSSLTTVTISNSVTSIGDFAFYNCGNLNMVKIPNSVTSIGVNAFSDCYGLESITIPDSVTSIGDGAFSWCSSLATVTIPDSVTSIGNGAFLECSSLNEITLPDSLKSIGSEAFDFTGYYENKENWENGILYCGKYLINVESDIRGDYAIKDETLVVANGAFYGCKNLTSVTIPNSVTSVGNYAFFNCYSLTSVKIGNSVTSIGYNAFSDCYGLESITISNSVTSIGDFAFIGCENLTIYCYSGSVAEKYAQENDIPFVAFRLTGISIKILPNKLRYYVRSSSLDTTGLTLLLTYSDDTTETVTSGYTISEFNADTTGEKTLTVTYKDLTTAFTVTVFCDHRMGHDVAAEESTCTTHGHGAYTVCDECGEIISGSDEELPLKAHNTYIKDYKAATCGAAGYTGNTVCKTCNTVVKKGTTIKATGHKTSTKITPATLSANGKIEYKCSVCKKKVASSKAIARIKTITLPATSYTYNGSYKKPTVTVKASSGRVLKNGTDYTVTYKNNKYVGTATATVTFKGYYKGSKNLYFKIIPQSTSLSKLTAGNKQLKVTWKKNSTVTGYQIQYSTSKSFSSYKTVTVKSYKTTSATLSKLSSKKNYYVRIRTYKTVNGKYAYSNWSTYKYCKTK